MKTRFCLLLILIFTASSLIVVRPADAAIPKPSVPEFTLEFDDESYDVPTTYEIDPYTGENVTHPGYHVPRTAFKMTIENQPFVPYYDEESEWNISFYYNIRMKGSYSEDWIELYRPSDGYPHQSDIEYTVISLGTLGGTGLALKTSAKMIDVPSGGQVDFQVEAMIGYVHRSGVTAIPGSGWTFTGEKSGWSSTQTITIPASSTPPPSPTPLPEQITEPTRPPEPQSEPFPIVPVAALLASVVVVAVGLVICFKKRGSEAKPS